MRLFWHILLSEACICLGVWCSTNLYLRRLETCLLHPLYRSLGYNSYCYYPPTFLERRIDLSEEFLVWVLHLLMNWGDKRGVDISNTTSDIGLRSYVRRMSNFTNLSHQVAQKSSRQHSYTDVAIYLTTCSQDQFSVQRLR